MRNQISGAKTFFTSIRRFWQLWGLGIVFPLTSAKLIHLDYSNTQEWKKRRDQEEADFISNYELEQSKKTLAL